MRIQWVKREKKTLSALGIHPQPGSGNGETFKEDGESPRLHVQLKSTSGKAVSLRLLDWKQLEKHAFTTGKVPVFLLEFVGGPILLCFQPGDLEEVVKHFQEETEMFVHTDALPKALEDEETYEDVLKFL